MRTNVRDCAPLSARHRTPDRRDVLSMRQLSADPLALHLLLSIGVALLAGPACNRKLAETQSAANTTRGEIAGVHYIEHTMGGARLDERLPMIVALHAMDGDPAYFLHLFRHYRRRARLILPYGHPSGGMYFWYNSAREDVAAPLVTREADRIAAALAALVATRPTVGRPIVTGFSQGGIMAFALVVTHPEALAAAFPISGLLPTSLYPSAALSSVPRPATLPPVAAFHGASDLAVSTQSARTSIAELRRAGYTAELREYAGIEHDISAAEEAEILERIGRAADGLAVSAP